MNTNTNERIIDKFLKEYVQDLIECSSDDYNITDSQIDDIVCDIEDNEHVWNIFDEAILQELGRYVKEPEPVDVVGFDKETELERLHRGE